MQREESALECGVKRRFGPPASEQPARLDRNGPKRRFTPHSKFFFFWLLLLLAAGLRAVAMETPPRLMVVVSIDQFPREYLDRFAPLFGERGFRRLLEDGADFRQAHHGHFVTATAPGHAVMLTGAYPNRNGVPGNWWYSREHKRTVASVTDERFPALGAAEPEGFSPAALSAPAVGDALRAATGMRAKVIAAAIKDRGSIMMGGQRPNAAYWYDPATCRFVSSTYYLPALPEWVERFNASDACTRYVGRHWQRLRDGADYARYADRDDAPYERDVYGIGTTFPHPVREWSEARNRYAAVVGTPFGGELLAAFARAAIEAEELGRDEVPDLLALSFSSNDYIGHTFGPHSQEVLDATLRTDAVLAELMRYLDDEVGKDRWVLALTSDHGIAPVSEYLEQRGLLPVRDDHHRLPTAPARAALERALAQDFFADDGAPKGFPGFVEAWERTEPFVYLNLAAIARLRPPVSVESVERAARHHLEKTDGIERVYLRSELSALAASRDPVEQMAYRNWHPERCGELMVQLEPFWTASEGRLATTHGQPYRYDTHVPLLLYGGGVRGGRIDRPVTVVDLASTLARLLGIAPPARDEGAPLAEALRKN